MSQKSMILLGMTAGTLIGGYVPVMLGADGLSFASLLGSGMGGVAGIWLMYRITR